MFSLRFYALYVRSKGTKMVKDNYKVGLWIPAYFVYQAH